jgi:hypothetical protein
VAKMGTLHGLGVPKFVPEFLRPFTRYEIQSLADFSSRLPESTPSTATAEGRHVRCFEKVRAGLALTGGLGTKHVVKYAYWAQYTYACKRQMLADRIQLVGIPRDRGMGHKLFSQWARLADRAQGVGERGDLGTGHILFGRWLQLAVGHKWWGTLGTEGSIFGWGAKIGGPSANVGGPLGDLGIEHATFNQWPRLADRAQAVGGLNWQIGRKQWGA